MKKMTLGMAALVVAGTGVSAGAAVLDDFNRTVTGDGLVLLQVPETIFDTLPYTDSETVVMEAGLFGDDRTFTITESSPSGRGTATASILGIGGILSFDTGINSTPGNSSLDVVYNDFAPTDVTADGSSVFQVVVADIDGSFEFKLTLNDGVNEETHSIVVSTIGTSNIDLSDFVVADVTNVTEITFTASNDSTAADVALDRLGFAVPEPSSLALLGLGGLLIARRRRG